MESVVSESCYWIVVDNFRLLVPFLGWWLYSSVVVADNAALEIEDHYDLGFCSRSWPDGTGEDAFKEVVWDGPLRHLANGRHVPTGSCRGQKLTGRGVI